MSEQWTAALRDVWRGAQVRDRVRAAAWLAVLAHVGVTIWVLSGAWFYSDDFIFLADADATSLSIGFLFTPHDSQLMPVGVLISWIVAQAGPFSWATAVLTSVLLAALAVWACARMLRVIFGERPLVLVPLFFYALSPMAIEGWVWWAAALNSLPIHVAFFLAITAVVQWWRSRRPAHLLAALGSVALGALSGPRGLVMTVTIGLLVLLVLVTPPEWKRPGTLVRRLLPLVVPGALVATAYLLVYRATTPAPVTTDGSAPAADIAKNLLIESWLPSLLGGPLRWFENNPPMNQPAAPRFLIGLAALVLAAVLARCWLRRPRVTTAAVLILVAHLTVTLVALIYGRGLQLGADAGLMTRYLTDTLPVTTLVVGLLLIPVAQGTQEPEVTPLGRWPVPVIAAVAVAFGAASLTTTATYASTWHADYPAREWVQNARAHLADDRGPVADVTVPALVQSPLSYPHNLPSRLLAPLEPPIRAVSEGTSLRVLDEHGVPRPATIFASVTAEPGPEPQCGYRVDQSPVDISMDPDRTNFFWWISLGYLASADGEVEVEVDDREPFTMPVFQGLNTYMFSGQDPVSTIRLTAVTTDLTVCVDTVRLGDLVPLP